LFLPLTDRIELTELLGDIAGDTRIDDPRLSGSWRASFREEHPATDGRPALRFITLARA